MARRRKYDEDDFDDEDDYRPRRQRPHRQQRSGSGFGVFAALGAGALGIVLTFFACCGGSLALMLDTHSRDRREQPTAVRAPLAEPTPSTDAPPVAEPPAPEPPLVKEPPVVREAPSVTPDQPPQREIPTDVICTILDEQVVPGIKRSLDVRVNRRVSEDVLRALAAQLKSSDPKNYERTFIAYYLPDMRVGAGAWATTHFNPDLEIRVLGLTPEQEAALKKESGGPSRQVIGSWFEESPGGLSRRLTLFQEGGKLYLESRYKDGSGGKKEMVERKSPLGRRFDAVEGSDAGEYWILDSSGNFQLHDNEGLIKTARAVK